ncbi:hypothetical protein SFRURICE_005621 [Spodoptera frugiperda]|nr:hypothetical protein SFRURICE_005621 [Spodoptera frugiperda]
MGKDTKFLATLPTRRIHRVLHIKELLRYRGLHLGPLHNGYTDSRESCHGFIVIYIQIICYARGCQKMRIIFMTCIFKKIYINLKPKVKKSINI